jgi:glucosamine-6-phosphate deaminase
MEIYPEYLQIPANELTRQSKIPLEILPDLPALYKHFARSIADRIQSNNLIGNPTRLILPVGPIGQYPILVEICNKERISWENVHIFHMDEYCDWQGRSISRGHPLSFRGFMEREVYSKLDPNLHIPEDQRHFPDPIQLDEISREIQTVGGIDCCYGGIGYHGHIAFNEPIISRWYEVSAEAFLRSKTRIIKLAPETVVMNSIRATGGNPAALPPMAVTLGMADIYAAKRIRLYCQGGAWQRTVLRIALMVEDDVRYPVTLLHKHGNIKIITTENTARTPKIQTRA